MSVETLATRGAFEPRWTPSAVSIDVRLAAIDVASYATGGTGTDADPFTGWAAAVPWGDRKAFSLRDATFSCATLDLSAYELFTLFGSGNASKLQITGAGVGIVLGDSTPGDINNNRFGIKLRDFWINGNVAGTSTIGVAAYLTHHCHYSGLKVTNFATTKFLQAGGVRNYFEHLDLTGVQATGDNLTWSVNGLVLDTRGGAFEQCTATTLVDTYVSHCTGKGLWVKDICSGIKIIGGGVEGVIGGYGYYFEATTINIEVIGGHSELNSLGDYIHGFGHRITDWFQESALSVPGSFITFWGGQLGAVDASAGSNNGFYHLRYNTSWLANATTTIYRVSSTGGVFLTDTHPGAPNFLAGISERNYATKLGEWAAFVPGGGAAAGVLTIGVNVRTEVMRIGQTVWIAAEWTGCTLTLPTPYVTLTLPFGLTSAIAARTVGALAYNDNGTPANGIVRASGNTLYLTKDIENSANFAASAANSKFSFTATVRHS